MLLIRTSILVMLSFLPTSCNCTHWNSLYSSMLTSNSPSVNLLPRQLAAGKECPLFWTTVSLCTSCRTWNLSRLVCFIIILLQNARAHDSSDHYTLRFPTISLGLYNYTCKIKIFIYIFLWYVCIFLLSMCILHTYVYMHIILYMCIILYTDINKWFYVNKWL